MPMLANVLLRTQGKNPLLVAATDLEVEIAHGTRKVSLDGKAARHSLGLENDLTLVARDDELGRRLQDAALARPEPRKPRGLP